MNLFGERLDGERAAADRAGLGVRRRTPSSSTGPPSSPARAAEAPRELATRVKATLRHAPWHAGFDDALRFELEHQVWSFRQPELAERMRRRTPEPLIV